MRKAALIVGTIILMAASGFGAFDWAITVLFGLGSKYHNIYDYYGYTNPWWSILLVLGSTAAGFIAPAALIWHLHKHSWRFSLRLLLVLMTVVALLIGSYTYFSTM